MTHDLTSSPTHTKKHTHTHTVLYYKNNMTYSRVPCVSILNISTLISPMFLVEMFLELHCGQCSEYHILLRRAGKCRTSTHASFFKTCSICTLISIRYNNNNKNIYCLLNIGRFEGSDESYLFLFCVEICTLFSLDVAWKHPSVRNMLRCN